LREVLGRPFIPKSAEFDLPAFLGRLNAAVKENKTGFDAWKLGPADWDRKLIWLWGVNPDQPYIDPAGNLTGKIPLLCLWSGPAIVRYFGLVMDDASVRRQLGRLGLVQNDQSLRFRLEETKHYGKKLLCFVR